MIRAQPYHKQPSHQFKTLADALAHDKLRAEQARIYFDYLASKNLFQTKYK